MRNEEEQLTQIIAAAKTVPRKVGIFIDDYKEERFLKRLQAELPATEFIITVHPGPTPKTKLIVVVRMVGFKISNN